MKKMKSGWTGWVVGRGVSLMVGLSVAVAGLAGCASEPLKNGSVTYGEKAYGGQVVDDVSEVPVAGAELVVYVDALTEYSSPRLIIGSVSTDAGGRFLVPANRVTIPINEATLSVSRYPVLRLTHPRYRDMTMELKRGDLELELRMKPRRVP